MLSSRKVLVLEDPRGPICKSLCLSSSLKSLITTLQLWESTICGRFIWYELDVRTLYECATVFYDFPTIFVLILCHMIVELVALARTRRSWTRNCDRDNFERQWCRNTVVVHCGLSIVDVFSRCMARIVLGLLQRWMPDKSVERRRRGERRRSLQLVLSAEPSKSDCELLSIARRTHACTPSEYLLLSDEFIFFTAENSADVIFCWIRKYFSTGFYV